MNDRETSEEAVREEKENLLLLVASPLAWALHLAVSYSTAAIHCAKASAHGGLLVPRVVIAICTLLALAVIFVVGRRGYRSHRLGESPPPHDADTAEDRHRFLGFATLLLSGLSAVAVVFEALPAIFIGSCH